MNNAFLVGLDEYELWQFLATRGSDCHIVAPQNILSRILGQAGDPRFTYSSELTTPVGPDKAVFVWDLDPGALDKARMAFPGSRVFGMLRDLWCTAVNHGDVYASVSAAPNPPLRYAIVCSPRSGSSFLCELLKQAGFGSPVEHVRDFFIELCRRGHRFDSVMSWMMQRGTRGGYFGTKLISHCLQELAEAGHSPAAIRDFLRRGNFRIIRLWRDPVAEAVSAYFATETGIWHLRGPETRNVKYDAVRYDSAALFEAYEFMVDANRFVAEFTSHLGPVLEINYADLDRDPPKIVARVAEFLDATPDAALRIDASQTVQKISQRQSRMQEYVNRLRRELEERPVAPA